MPSSYLDIPIVDCAEPLLAIPHDVFVLSTPHPYVALGAPYGTASPWQLRRGVLAALQRAQHALQRCHPGWRLKLFDAWRPLAVQHFMVWREFQQQARRCSLDLGAAATPQELQQLAPAVYAVLAERVFEFWGIPDTDPARPPPHSTGAAVDLSLVDAAGHELDMGCPIDETSVRAYPDHYAHASDAAGRACHDHRQILHSAMTSAGFVRHANEWWHYSRGDQMWAQASGAPLACYGRVQDGQAQAA